MIGMFSNCLFLLEILGVRHKGKNLEYNIKWEDYEDSTWEPSTNIPKFIRDYYESTGNGKVPTPRVKEVKKVGSVSQYELVWSNDTDLPFWDPEKHVLIEPTDVEVGQDRVCNTRNRAIHFFTPFQILFFLKIGFFKLDY